MDRLPLIAALAACLLAGCDRQAPPASPDAVADAGSLPRPDADGGSVTGFDGDAPPPAPPAEPPPENGVRDIDPLAIDPLLPVAGGFDLGGTPPEPGAGEAVAVIRSYYDAISAADYPVAYALWSDGGNASGQTLQQFERGFRDTTRVTVHPGAPGRVEGAAGSRYVTVPVAIEAVHADGSVHHYDGSYTLRRAVVDGATDEQRRWRISDADLREVE